MNGIHVSVEQWWNRKQLWCGVCLFALLLSLTDWPRALGIRLSLPSSTDVAGKCHRALSAFVLDGGDQTQVFVHAQQALHPPSHLSGLPITFSKPKRSLLKRTRSSLDWFCEVVKLAERKVWSLCGGLLSPLWFLPCVFFDIYSCFRPGSSEDYLLYFIDGYLGCLLW